METVLDLLEPEREGLNISEDPSTGEVVCAGARVIEVTNLQGLVEILEVRVDTCVIEISVSSSRAVQLLIKSSLPRSPSGTHLERGCVYFGGVCRWARATAWWRISG